ncbi:serine/threonine-protein kinase PknH/PknJ [Mycobacterium avium]|uniref:serine/threonine-protein kinase PknH/PknJ n=1 Tax=Mycobacterium avium TaxID=1764 RepID=UPI001D2D9440|nr:serine/threonine-protein kinase PknH/PknJ [Mycobacterium avium]MBZ4521834.1 protein kinase [Mycobacterium avium subsp. hominissuis]MBZ4531154.1 protein kinase [Mycobacterium avium subsp. hominissuis]
MPLSGGQTFAGYRIVRLLGSGGMGEVYLAEHPRLPRYNALKVLPADVSADPDYRARFHREADLASKLWHPNIVSVHDRGDYDGQLWISMDFVDGIDAGRLVAERFSSGMPISDVAAIVTAVAGALDYAHKQGLLHRDVKPANIIITHYSDDDAERRILLADFGIARNVDDISGLTATNFTVGTVAYSAPEQLMGKDLDGRADQYALAATAHHLLTGSHMFPYSNQAVMISHHLNVDPPKLRDAHPELAALDPILARALAKDPRERFPRCADFARHLANPTLQTGSHSPAAATEPAPLPRAVHSAGGSAKSGERTQPDRRQYRRQLLRAAAALGILALAGAITVTWRPWEKHESARAANASTQQPAAAPALTPLSERPAPAPPPLMPDSAIGSVMLTPAEINTVVTANSTEPLLQAQETTYGMLNDTNLVTPQECVGIVFTGEHAVFAGTGFTAMRNQILQRLPGGYATHGLTQVEQSVVAFPNSDQANAVLASSHQRWTSCAAGRVRRGTVGQNGENNLTFDFGTVRENNGVLSVVMVANSQESTGAACQQVMAAKANIVVEVRSCRDPDPPPGELEAPLESVHKDATPLVNAMLDKITV